MLFLADPRGDGSSNPAETNPPLLIISFYVSFIHGIQVIFSLNLEEKLSDNLKNLNGAVSACDNRNCMH